MQKKSARPCGTLARVSRVLLHQPGKTNESALHGPVEADAAEDESARIEQRVTAALQGAGEFVHRDKVLQRIRDVGIGARLAVQQRAPESALRVEVGEVSAAKKTIRGKKKIERDEQTAGTSDALDFP